MSRRSCAPAPPRDRRARPPWPRAPAPGDSRARRGAHRSSAARRRARTAPRRKASAAPSAKANPRSESCSPPPPRRFLFLAAREQPFRHLRPQFFLRRAARRKPDVSARHAQELVVARAGQLGERNRRTRRTDVIFFGDDVEDRTAHPRKIHPPAAEPPLAPRKQVLAVKRHPFVKRLSRERHVVLEPGLHRQEELAEGVVLALL